MSDERTWQDVIDEAIEELEDWFEENPFAEPHDFISEQADSSTPIYTGTILQYAADNIELATNEPEIGPAFDGSPTPVNIIATNMYEAIEAALWERYRELEEERDEADEDEDEEEEEDDTDHEEEATDD